MKYKIVLAEDEENVRRLLVKHINSSDSEFYVTGEAENGKEALELIEKERPDILMTDICMPGMDGLELIRKVRETDEDLPIIVVSGYDDFSYAKGAMSMGVREYLLKPFLPKEMFEALRKTSELIEQKNVLKTNIESMSRQLRQSEEYTREYLLRQLFDGNVESEDLERNLKNAGMLLDDSRYCAAIVRFELTEIEESKTEQVLKTYMNIIKDNYFAEDIDVYVIPDKENQLALLFAGKGESKKVFRQEIKTGMEKIALSMEQYHKMKLHCTVGRIYETYQEISASYQEALDTWRGVLSSDVTVAFYQESRFGTRDLNQEQISNLEENVLVDIQVGDEEKAVKGISDILDYYGDLFVGNVEYISISLVKLVLKISDVTEKAGGNIQAWNDQKVITYLKRHFTYGSLMEAKGVLTEYVKKCCAQFQKINASQGEKIIQNAKIIIEKNLSNEEFGLELLAEEMHFSSNYVRQLFKANTGMSFSDYLIEKRMSLAEKLLRNPSFKIQEIAEMTGYSDQRYFARCFKKYYGCTPTEYRKNLETL